jgi:hypothetical protein
MPVKVILETLYSRRDKSGNCYFAFRYTDAASGKQVVGTASGGESNVRSMLRPLGLDSEEVYSTIKDLGIREFNYLTRNWPYAGCTAEQVAAFVQAKLAKKG